MSATPPPRSPSLSAEPDGARSSHPPVQTEVKTPERKPGALHSVPDLTPPSNGSARRQRQEGDTDRVEKYNCADYDDYIREDLKSRVFVDFEVFMKHVLHVPDDWETLWGPAIKATKTDPNFKRYHEEYCKYCNAPSLRELLLYEPLKNMANAVLDVLSRSACSGISPKIPQRYHVNNPNKLRGGVINKAGLSPDLVVLHEDRQPSGKQDLHWANPLHIVEVKPHKSAICDGASMPRLVIDGLDPISTHAFRPMPLQHKATKSTPTTTSGSSKSMKRSADGSSTTDRPANKKSRTAPNLDRVRDESASTRVGEGDESSSTSKLETQLQVNPAIQVCRYLLEMFSVPLLRSHATVSLVDRSRLQLYHANRSVILVSSAINFSEESGLDKFIAVIIAFHCLSFRQNGILDTLVEENIKLVKNSKIPADDKMVQEGNRLEFLGNSSEEGFTVNLGNVISRDPAIIGRSTVVLEATSDQWPKSKLAVKVSWPGSGRVPESEFLKKANEEAEKAAGKWATKHLPWVFYARDIVFDQDSTFESIARLFKNAKFAGGNYVHEPRTLRVIIQERLYPLKSLANVKDIGQVFLDVGCVHHWLYQRPGILHRDLSLNNIMYRLIMEKNAKGEPEQKVYGVLTDYDLSSWKKDLKGDYTRTSQQRTGTPPYMAQELLKGTSTTHLYRHDVESLFYVMLMVCGRHTFGPVDDGAGEEARQRVVMREGELPYQKWFNAQDYEMLGSLKASFFLDRLPIDLSPAFEDFRPWLDDLHSAISEGFNYKNSHPSNVKLPSWKRQRNGGSAGEVKPTSVPLDDETLGGHVNYSAIIEPTRYLKGELEGLIIRYDTVSDSDGTVQADT